MLGPYSQQVASHRMRWEQDQNEGEDCPGCLAWQGSESQQGIGKEVSGTRLVPGVCGYRVPPGF